MKPPFGYYGAKQRIASQIISHLPPHYCWVEAFCGSAAITLAKNPAPIEIINDVDDQIVNLFQQLRDNPEELCRVVTLTPYSRTEFKMAKKREDNISAMEKARRFLVSTMMTVNGANGGEQAGFSHSQSYSRNGKEARVNRWYNLPERIELLVERLRVVRIENQDARILINKFSKRPATLIYLDPPYLMERTQTYAFDANTTQFHAELLDICCKSNSMIFISGYENELYNSVLTKERGWSKDHIQTTTRDTTGKDHARIEVIWKNENFTNAIGKELPPIFLTTKEKKTNKINPAR